MIVEVTVVGGQGADTIGRRERIGDAGIGLITRDGVHAPTHLQVDTEAGLPRGPTSYYAQTRRDLLALVVNRLSEDSQADIDDLETPASVSRQETTETVIDVLEHIARRTDAQAACGALLFELRDDVELRELLAAEAPIRQPLTRLAERVLLVAGVNQTSAHAPDLMGLMDALLMYQTAKAAPVNARRVLRAYFEGLD